MIRPAVVLIGLWLFAALFVPECLAQSSGPQYYTGDVPPATDIISKSLIRQYGKQAATIILMGVHKVTETEYLILTGAPDIQGIPPSKTVMYNLWRLESREWVIMDPFTPVGRYIKILTDKP